MYFIYILVIVLMSVTSICNGFLWHFFLKFAQNCVHTFVSVIFMCAVNGGVLPRVTSRSAAASYRVLFRAPCFDLCRHLPSITSYVFPVCCFLSNVFVLYTHARTVYIFIVIMVTVPNFIWPYVTTSNNLHYNGYWPYLSYLPVLGLLLLTSTIFSIW